MTGEVWVRGRGARITVAQDQVTSLVLLPLRRPQTGAARFKLPRGAISPMLKKSLSQAAEYLAGKRRRFTVRFVQSGSPFQMKVWEALAGVPFGRVVTYGELAALAGRPRAARAVGTAMNRNRVPLLVPCHRVVASNGIGGFGCGLDWKRLLLDLEGAPEAVAGRGRRGIKQ